MSVASVMLETICMRDQGNRQLEALLPSARIERGTSHVALTVGSGQQVNCSVLWDKQATQRPWRLGPRNSTNRGCARTVGPSERRVWARSGHRPSSASAAFATFTMVRAARAKWATRSSNPSCDTSSASELASSIITPIRVQMAGTAGRQQRNTRDYCGSRGHYEPICVAHCPPDIPLARHADQHHCGHPPSPRHSKEAHRDRWRRRLLGSSVQLTHCSYRTSYHRKSCTSKFAFRENACFAGYWATKIAL